MHHLNPVPIQLIHDRWLSKYAQPFTWAMTSLKTRLESPPTAANQPSAARPRKAKPA